MLCVWGPVGTVNTLMKSLSVSPPLILLYVPAYQVEHAVELLVANLVAADLS